MWRRESQRARETEGEREREREREREGHWISYGSLRLPIPRLPPLRRFRPALHTGHPILFRLELPPRMRLRLSHRHLCALRALRVPPPAAAPSPPSVVASLPAPPRCASDRFAIAVSMRSSSRI